MKLSKILKKLPESVVAEIDEKSADRQYLQATVAAAEEAIAKAFRERDAMPAYQAAKQAVKDLSEALKDVKSYQTVKIHYCLRKLRELDGEEVGDE